MRRAAGFVLVEAMVATIIVALILAATFRTVSQTARGTQAAAETRMALLVARSELTAAAAGAGTRGGADGDIVWATTIAPAGGPGAAGPLTRVTVTAGTRARPRIVTLTTLTLPGLP